MEITINGSATVEATIIKCAAWVLTHSELLATVGDAYSITINPGYSYKLHIQGTRIEDIALALRLTTLEVNTAKDGITYSTYTGYSDGLNIEVVSVGR